MTTILAWAASFIISVIESTGYPGIIFLMSLEGSFIPVPSEIILPFSGYLVSLGRFSLFWVAFWGAVGNIIGSVFSYSVSRYLGLSFLYKYGKYVFVTRKDIEDADTLFKKHGAKIIFISRLIPGIRGFVPIPAGIARMNLTKFIVYVFSGSFIYSLLLTYIGVLAGENWDFLEPYFHAYDWTIIALGIIIVVWWIRRYFKAR